MPREIRTLGPAVARFFERHYRHTKGPAAGQPFVLEPWQRAVLDEAYEVDEHGRRVYRLIVEGVPRGNGKTPRAAGLGIRELVTRRDSPDIFTAAGSRDQARILLDFARTFVENDRDLGRWIKPSRNFLSCKENAGIMRVLSSHGSLQMGLSVSSCFVDELHAWMIEQQVELYNALWTALHKRVDSFMYVITTAGFDKESLLGRIYDECLALGEQEDRLGGCLRIRRDRENGILFVWYGLPEERADEWADEELWRACNPASWVSLRDLRRQLNAPGFDELDFKRLHLNMWTATRESWFPPGAWAGLRAETVIPEGAGVYVAIDAAYSYDTTAVAWAWPGPDGRVHVRAHVWTVRPEAPAHVHLADETLDNEQLVEPFVHALGQRYRIREVVFDPRYFSTEGRHLGERYTAAPLQQASGEMVDAVQHFYKAVTAATLAYANDYPMLPAAGRPHDWVLTAHVEATAGRKTDSGWRISKSKAQKPIDACVATVMAHWRAARPGKSAPTITWL
jgi:phage terminase large subunit-like protein